MYRLHEFFSKVEDVSEHHFFSTQSPRQKSTNKEETLLHCYYPYPTNHSDLIHHRTYKALHRNSTMFFSHMKPAERNDKEFFRAEIKCLAGTVSEILTNVKQNHRKFTIIWHFLLNSGKISSLPHLNHLFFFGGEARP